MTPRQYLAMLIAGLVVEIPLLLWIMAAEPFGVWTSIVVPMALPVAGGAVALLKGWHRYES